MYFIVKKTLIIIFYFTDNGLQPNGEVTQGSLLSKTEESPSGDHIKPKAKKVPCSCPNCKDGDRGGEMKKKMHICHIPGCNKLYRKTSHLRAHLRWHSDDKPFVCAWNNCNKKFTRSDELQVRIKVK